MRENYSTFILPVCWRSTLEEARFANHHSQLCVLAPAILSTIAVGDGFGMHVYNIAPGKMIPLSLLINSIVTVLILASALSKTSFVLTVLRFVQGWMRWAAWFILVSTNVLFGINIILAWLIFNPNPIPSS